MIIDLEVMLVLGKVCNALYQTEYRRYESQHRGTGEHNIDYAHGGLAEIEFMHAQRTQQYCKYACNGLVFQRPRGVNACVQCRLIRNLHLRLIHIALRNIALRRRIGRLRRRCDFNGSAAVWAHICVHFKRRAALRTGISCHLYRSFRCFSCFCFLRRLKLSAIL